MNYRTEPKNSSPFGMVTNERGAPERRREEGKKGKERGGKEGERATEMDSAAEGQ